MSDPVVGYDLKHHTWLISGLTVNDSAIATGVAVNRSPDGLHWSKPITVSHPAAGFVDKDWATRDDDHSSPHYGNCYAQFDLDSPGELLLMSVSTDGGRTWSSPKPTADMAHGLGGQPLVQPNGTVVVPYEGFHLGSGAQYIGSFVSTYGGATWSAHHVVSPIDVAVDGGAIRNSPLPSAQEDAAGTVYVVWNDSGSAPAARATTSCCPHRPTGPPGRRRSASPSGASPTTPTT